MKEKIRLMVFFVFSENIIGFKIQPTRFLKSYFFAPYVQNCIKRSFWSFFSPVFRGFIEKKGNVIKFSVIRINTQVAQQYRAVSARYHPMLMSIGNYRFRYGPLSLCYWGKTHKFRAFTIKSDIKNVSENREFRWENDVKWLNFVIFFLGKHLISNIKEKLFSIFHWKTEITISFLPLR